HLLRNRDCRLALARGEALHFDDVTALTLHAIGHLVQRIFGVLAKDGLAGLEADFGLIGSLVLVDISNHGFDGLNTSCRLLRALLRHGGFVTGVNRVLVGLIGLVGGHLDSGLSAGVGVFDRLAV